MTTNIVKSPKQITAPTAKSVLTGLDKQELETSRFIVVNFVAANMMRVYINGQIFTPYEGSPLAPCAYCKGELPKAEVALGLLGRQWIIAKGNPAKMLMQDARNPLSRIQGFPVVVMVEYCPSCKGKHSIVGQLLI